MRKIRFDGDLSKTITRYTPAYFSDKPALCSGRQYFEYAFAHHNSSKDCYFFVGIATKDHSSFSVASQMISSDSSYNNLYLENSKKEKTNNLNWNAWTGTYGISLDFSSKLFFIYINGHLVGQQNLVFDHRKEHYFVLTNGCWGGDTFFNSPVDITMNFGESVFTNPCPAGFTPVCDYGGQTVYVTDKDVAYGITAEGTQTLTKLSDHWSSLSKADKVNALQSVKEEANTETLKSFADPFKICGLYPQNSNVRGMVKGLKKEKVVTPKKLIRLGNFEALTKASITSTVSGAAAVKVGVTTDLNHYKTYDLVAAKWKDIDMTSADSFISTAMNAADVQLIPEAAWQEILDYVDGGVGFAYCTVATTTGETCNVDKLTFTANMKGTWKSALKGTVYDYGYPLNDVLQVKLYADGNYKINYSMGAKAP